MWLQTHDPHNLLRSSSWHPCTGVEVQAPKGRESEGFFLFSSSVVSDSATHRTPLSMRSPRQETWSGLPFPPPGHLPDPGTEPASPALTGRFFIDWATREAQMRLLLSKHPFPFPDTHERSLPLWALTLASVCDLHGPQMEHSATSLSLHPRKFLPCSSGSLWPPWEKYTSEVQPWSFHPGVNTRHMSRATPTCRLAKQTEVRRGGRIQWYCHIPMTNTVTNRFSEVSKNDSFSP